MQIIPFFYHLASLSVITYGLFYFLYHVPVYYPTELGGPFKFLTVINMVLLNSYLLIALLNDLFGSTNVPGSKRQRSFLQKISDTMHTSLAFPLGTLVSLVFWGLYFVDRELIFPAAVDKFVPVWLNHVKHSVNFGILFIEKLLIYHQAPSWYIGIPILIFLAVCYQSFILYAGLVHNIWIYKILEVLEWPQRIAFFVLTWFIVIFLYFIGNFITNLIWQANKPKKPTKKDIPPKAKKDTSKSHSSNSNQSSERTTPRKRKPYY